MMVRRGSITLPYLYAEDAPDWLGHLVFGSLEDGRAVIQVTLDHLDIVPLLQKLLS